MGLTKGPQVKEEKRECQGSSGSEFSGILVLEASRRSCGPAEPPAALSKIGSSRQSGASGGALRRRDSGRALMTESKVCCQHELPRKPFLRTGLGSLAPTPTPPPLRLTRKSEAPQTFQPSQISSQVSTLNSTLLNPEPYFLNSQPSTPGSRT